MSFVFALTSDYSHLENNSRVESSMCRHSLSFSATLEWRWCVWRSSLNYSCCPETLVREWGTWINKAVVLHVIYTPIFSSLVLIREQRVIVSDKCFCVSSSRVSFSQRNIRGWFWVRKGTTIIEAIVIILSTDRLRSTKICCFRGRSKGKKKSNTCWVTNSLPERICAHSLRYYIK